MPLPKKGKTIPDEIISNVINFFEDDEVGRLCLGAKDYVSVKTGDGRDHRQKRLILGNLKEIYKLFKEKYPSYRIRFSKFCQLRPKWCVTASCTVVALIMYVCAPFTRTLS